MKKEIIKLKKFPKSWHKKEKRKGQYLYINNTDGKEGMKRILINLKCPKKK